jgi:thymidylate synthase
MFILKLLMFFIYKSKQKFTIMNGEKSYLDIVSNVLAYGKFKQNRTGVGAYTMAHAMVQHDMALGFPLLTTKKMGIKSIGAELEGFIKGITDKQWFIDRKCTIWNEWSNPKKIPTGLTDEERKAFQLDSMDLGKIYGYQWRNFNSQGYDQVAAVVNTLKSDPNNRRMIVSGWNPNQLDEMALPPCHVLHHLTVIDDTLNLCWFQRSVDVGLGLPYNLASYALLLHLYCKESGLKEGVVTGFLSDVHIYENHVDALKGQLERTPSQLPTINTDKFNTIFDWEFTDTVLHGYTAQPAIKMAVAV